jgi:hypothetical protein
MRKLTPGPSPDASSSSITGSTASYASANPPDAWHAAVFAPRHASRARRVWAFIMPEGTPRITSTTRIARSSPVRS